MLIVNNKVHNGLALEWFRNLLLMIFVETSFIYHF